MPSALENITVIDLTTILAGPTATHILADHGANVIKVESLQGDLMRAAGPAAHDQMGHLYLSMNRNKRSISVDLKSSEGRSILMKLAEKADVLVYNIRPKAMERLSLGYEDLKAVNPRLIYAGALGFSQRGPYAARPAYDDLIQGMALIPWMTQMAGAEVPRYAPMAIADRIMGLHLTIAILTALQYQRETGKGQRVDVPMFEAVVATMLGEHLSGELFDPPRGPYGNARTLAVDRRPYQTKDGYVCALIYNDTHWKNFLRVIGQPGKFDDPRFASQGARLKNIGVVTAFLKEVLATRTTAEWLSVLSEADLPVAPMYTFEDIKQDPHLRAIEFFRQVEHPTEGRIWDVANPTEWSESPPSVKWLAPSLGQHTGEVLREAGYTPEEIAGFHRDGVVRSADAAR